MIALFLLLFALGGTLVFRYSGLCTWQDSVAISFGTVAVGVDLWAGVWLLLS